MEVFKDEQQLCPCYEECQEFQKLGKLKDSGLVVYCHRPRIEDIRQAEAVGSAVNTSRDVFILYNKKNVKITTSELTSELEKENISCPRCRKTFEHAEELMQEVKSIDRKMILGICDHCRKKAQKAQGSKKPFCVCDKIVKKFISVKGNQKEDTKKYFKTLPLKMVGYLRKDTMYNKENQNAYDDFQINRGLNSPASMHEPEFQQMFSHTHFKSGDAELGKTNLKEGYVAPAVAFIQPIEPVITFSAHTLHEGENINTIIPGTSLVDSVTTFVEASVCLKELPRPSLKDRKQGQIFEDRPSMDAKEALKRRHDLSLRQMMRLEKDSGDPYSVSKRPDIYETPKIVPWAQKDPTSKYYVESQMDMKIPTLRHGRGPRDPRGPHDLDYVSNKEVKFRSTRASQDSFIAPRKADKYHHDKIKQGLYDSEEGPRKVKKQEYRYNVDEELKLQRSVDKISHKTKKREQHVAKSKSGPIDSMRNVLEHQNSFFFSKVMDKEEKKTKIDVSSSQLIKDTQEKFRLQAESEKKRQEEDRQKKLEQAQKKKLVPEEKRLQAEEKKRKAIEEQKTYEKQRKLEEEQRKLEEEQKKIGQRKLEKEQRILEEEQRKLGQRKLEKEQRKLEEEQRKLEEAQKKIGQRKLEKERRKLEEEQRKLEKDQRKLGQRKLEKEQRKLEEEQRKLGQRKLEKEQRKLEEEQRKLGQRKLEKEQRKLEEEQRKLEEEQKKIGQRKLEKEQRKLGQRKLEKEQRKLEEEQRKLEEEQKKIGQRKLEKEQRKLEEEQRKLEKEQRKLEEEQKKLAEQKYSEKERKVKGKISKVSMVVKKKIMPKSDHREKTDGVSDKSNKDLQSGTEHEDKGVAKEQKIKPEKKHLDEKLQRENTDNENLKKQLEQSRKEKEARKVKSVKVLDTLFKKGKDSKKTRDDAIKVSLSNIPKSLKKESSGKQETLPIKRGKVNQSDGKTLKKEPSMTLGEISELQKSQAEHLKEKEKALNMKKQLECEAEVAKAKEEAERNAQKLPVEKIRIKILKEHSDTNLELVILKQTAKMGPSDIHPSVLRIQCNHQHSGKKSSRCQLCANSDLELEILSLDTKTNLTTHKTDIIIGEKIFKYKPRLEKIQEPEGVPILFQKEFSVEPDQQLKHIEQIITQETIPEQKEFQLPKTEMEQGKGVIRYALSDRNFIEKGWTMLPTEKVVRKMNVYRMRPAHPEFDWFEHNKDKGLMTYDTGERLAEFDDNGRGRWYYRSGPLALDYYDAKETNAQQRFVVYSSGEPDERGRTHPITILATFDYLGNGIVFDHAGKIRLKYNQTEGVVLDRGIGPISHWQWHSLNDPPVLQQVMIDTQMALKDPNIFKLATPADDTTRHDNEEMLAIEFDNFIKEKSKKLSQKFKPFQIRMKALKINEHFSLKVLDQATVYLIFRDGSTNLKLNIGMILDHHEIVDTDTAEVGEVSNNLERFPARTDSLAGLQRSVIHSQRYERQHAERERRLRPPEPCASADQLTAAASPPMRLPLRTVPTRSSSSTGYSNRKPTNNLYYDTRLCC